MKKGINAWCFPAGFSLEKCFQLASANGYEGIEINMSERGVAGEDSITPALTPEMGDAEYDAILSLSKQYALPVSSISTGLHWVYPLTSDCEEKRARGIAIVRKMLDAAAYLGADTVLVVPGEVTEAVTYKKAYQRAQEALHELKTYAMQKKVIIGIENVWNKFLLSPLEMRRFIDEIDSAWVKAYFDAGNVLQFSYPEHWVEILGDKIAKVHIKDFDTTIGNINGFKPLLQGHMNWEKLMKALRDVGYESYITPELEPYHTNPQQLIEDTSKALNYILTL